MEIANIENINLRERFISISNNLLSEQLDKEQQVHYIRIFINGGIILKSLMASPI